VAVMDDTSEDYFRTLELRAEIESSGGVTNERLVHPREVERTVRKAVSVFSAEIERARARITRCLANAADAIERGVRGVGPDAPACSAQESEEWGRRHVEAATRDLARLTADGVRGLVALGVARHSLLGARAAAEFAAAHRGQAVQMLNAYREARAALVAAGGDAGVAAAAATGAVPAAVLHDAALDAGADGAAADLAGAWGLDD
jgi:hypothetical protein